LFVIEKHWEESETLTDFLKMIPIYHSDAEYSFIMRVFPIFKVLS